MTTRPSGNDIALQLIAQDLMFLRRFFQAVATSQDRAVVPIFCLYNYMCLIIHESHKALRRIDPDLAAALAYNHAPAIERARNSVKLYDDKAKTPVAVSAEFRRIIEQHRHEHLNNTWLPLARPLETDLALWRFRGKLISTSHTVSFFLALPPRSLKPEVLGPVLYDIAVEQSRYVSTMADGFPWQGPSFLDTVAEPDLTANNVRAKKHYRGGFAPSLPEEVKASLTAMTCALNTLDILLAEEPEQSSAVSLWKLRYITLHHVLSSLSKLNEQYGASLRLPDRSVLNEILDAPMTGLILKAHGGFRNTLVHYVPLRNVHEQLSLHQPLYGLLDAYFSEADARLLHEGLASHTGRVAGILDAWSGSHISSTV
ncbi:MULTISPECIES: hypothetical protein [Streptomyces]|uniref:hypothetical protein n=1 Tax=Streptomyces TaxID=1883 RepID=UPI001E45C377|nr:MULTISPECIES: hypothetical protein [Streptomyces]UFQ13563.1 hypothetical protein J2N69_00170 [Streptomyces huasconensis]UFQ19971.1 hypothetical protein J2N69_36230 [Streptomyces huasconensis]WCL89592.1 hypothetical protein PPN52_36170 [Streptomyces sp. JCM 35825]